MVQATEVEVLSMGGLLSLFSQSYPSVKSLEDLFGDTLVTKVGEKKTTTELEKAGLILVYFSAHWCPPCRNFTPILVEFYNKLKSRGRNVELVFVSSDRSLPEFNNYYASMPWTALPFNSPKKSELSSRYNVSGIPKLIVIDPSKEFHVVDAEARNTVGSCKHPDQVLTKWGMSNPS